MSPTSRPASRKKDSSSAEVEKKKSAPKAARKATSASTQKPLHEKADVQTSMKLKEKEQAGSPKMKGIRIRLSAFDYNVLDEAAMKIVDTAVRTGAVVHGPTPLPTNIRKFTVNRSTFVHKDARDQFEMRTHRRLIDLSETTFKTVDALQNLSLPAGVSIEIKMG